jgi:hypothetical protein
MVDANIKKVTQSFSEMPPLNSITEGYDIRYRIISEDKNRLSHWSELSIVQPNYTFVPDEIQFSKAQSIASLAWDAVTINKVVDGETYFISKASEYDLWYRWDRGAGTGDWLYKERIQGTTVATPIPSTWTIGGVVQGTAPNRLSIEIYLKGNPIVRGDGIPLASGTPFLKVYELTNQTV